MIRQSCSGEKRLLVLLGLLAVAVLLKQLPVVNAGFFTSSLTACLGGGTLLLILSVVLCTVFAVPTRVSLLDTGWLLKAV